MKCFGLAAILMIASAGTANSATLIGEEVIFRFDIQGAPLPTAVIGAGQEFTDFSPTGMSRPWAWTVDFGASDFVITATTTAESFTINPHIAFASSTPGLIPLDLSIISFTEKSVSPSLLFADFSESITSTGISLSLLGGPSTVPVGTTVRWAGNLELGDASAVIPLPAPFFLLLTGLASLVGIGVMRRA